MKIKLKGGCLVANVLNNNHRIYPIEALENAHDTIQTYISYGSCLLGEPFNSEHLEIDLKKVSHKITNSYIENNILFIEAELLDSVEGYAIRDTILSGSPVYFTSRGAGNVNSNNIVEDYELSTVDISNDCSFNISPCEIIKEHIEISNDIKYNNTVKEIIDNLVE